MYALFISGGNFRFLLKQSRFNLSECWKVPFDGLRSPAGGGGGLVKRQGLQASWAKGTLLYFAVIFVV